ncbi:MAG: tRNA pseudouridine(55) synthase TruB [Zoogloeaceae bacterium]|nr:tRNA pseudouridine(55) synthase TruB [Zoogloeaceae bacterium]
MSQLRRAPRRQVDGVLLFDKPTGMTSNAALQKARWLFNAAKAGHTGTLDPMATGLLPLCFGEATKFAGALLDANKSYRATLKLGVTTDTADADGNALLTRPVVVDTEMWRVALNDFRGEIQQIPPMYSALKRDGRPLYEYARAGVELERQARPVTIHRLELVSFSGDEAVIEVDCSKGTYVRTLAADLGEKLGCGAHLIALRRTRIGDLNVTDSLSLAQLEALPPEARDTRLAPVDALLKTLPAAQLTAAEAERITHGQALCWQGKGEGAQWRLYAPQGQFLGLGELSADGWLKPRRLLTFDPTLTVPHFDKVCGT